MTLETMPKTKANPSRTTFVRIQEKGQVTLPAESRRRLGLKTGDLVAVTETPEGLLITPREVVATGALEGIGELLREQGITLEEMVASGRAIRGELVKETYGLDPERQPDEDPVNIRTMGE